MKKINQGANLESNGDRNNSQTAFIVVETGQTIF